jgi:hypothetical protein
MTESARYVKIVEWSDEDQCYVGSSPGLIFGGATVLTNARSSTSFVESSTSHRTLQTRGQDTSCADVRT